MSNKPSNAFIHRLIPVATAAGLTFSACVFPETEPTVVNNSQIDSNAASNNATSNNMTSGNNTTSANNTAANNTTVNNASANSTSPANNTGINSTTPANNTSVNNTSPINSTTPVNNTTPANNTSPNNTTPPNNSTPNNTTPANNTSPGTEDGQLSDEEIAAFCQGFYDCDATLFAESYDSVESCKQETRAYVDGTLSYIEQNYSVGCAMAYEAFYEGYLNAGMCMGGSFTIDEVRLSEIEATFDEAYNMYCLN